LDWHLDVHSPYAVVFWDVLLINTFKFETCTSHQEYIAVALEIRVAAFFRLSASTAQRCLSLCQLIQS
jgi:hypothetical protein